MEYEIKIKNIPEEYPFHIKRYSIDCSSSIIIDSYSKIDINKVSNPDVLIQSKKFVDSYLSFKHWVSELDSESLYHLECSELLNIFESKLSNESKLILECKD